MHLDELQWDGDWVTWVRGTTLVVVRRTDENDYTIFINDSKEDYPLYGGAVYRHLDPWAAQAVLYHFLKEVSLL